MNEGVLGRDSHQEPLRRHARLQPFVDVVALDDGRLVKVDARYRSPYAGRPHGEALKCLTRPVYRSDWWPKDKGSLVPAPLLPSVQPSIGRDDVFAPLPCRTVG